MALGLPELRENGRDALEKGDHATALAHYTEVVKRVPSDHRARFAAAKALVGLGERERAVTAYLAAAEGLLRRDYLLSAIAACKLSLLINPVEKRIKDALRRVHARAAASAPGRAQVPPPLPPESMGEGGSGSLLGLTGSELLDNAYMELSRTDESGPAADPSARPPLPLFADLEREAFVDLVLKMDYREYRTGNRIVTEGERGESVFIIVAGKAKVRKTDAEMTQSLAQLPGGALFGEMALLAGSPRTATVEASADTEAFEITRSVVEELAHAHKSVPQALADFGRRRLVQNLLATSTIFKPLTADERWDLWNRFSTRVYKPGDLLILEGQDPGGLFLVVTGEVEVSKRDSGGDHIVLAYLREGEVIGEISLVKERTATATVKAMRKTVAAYLPRADFKGAADAHPEILAYLENVSEERLRSTAQALAPSEILDASELVV